MMDGLINLCRPFADMYIFQVVNQQILSTENPDDATFIYLSLLILSISLFFTPESRTPSELKSRLVFLAVVAGISLFAHWKSRQVLGTPPPPSRSAAKPKP